MFGRRSRVETPQEPPHEPTPQETRDAAELNLRALVVGNIGQIALDNTEDARLARDSLNTSYITRQQNGKTKLESLLSIPNGQPSDNLIDSARRSLAAGSWSADAVSVLRAAGVSELDITSALYGKDITELIKQANPQPRQASADRPRGQRRDSQKTRKTPDSSTQ